MKRLLILVFGVSIFAFATAAAIFWDGPTRTHAFHPSDCADVDATGTVTQNDVDIVGVFIGQHVPPAPPYVDVTGNHVVNGGDLSFVAGRVGTTTNCQTFFFGNPWDVNRDGVVTAADLSLVAGAVGQTAALGDPKDLDRDGKITNADVKIVGGHIGQAVPPLPSGCADADATGTVTTNDVDIVGVFIGQQVPPAPRYVDMNGDNVITGADLSFVAGRVGTTTNCQTYFFGSPWDVNRDGVVTGADLSLVAGAVGNLAAAGDPKDVDRDGKVTNADVKIVGGHIGEVIP